MTKRVRIASVVCPARWTKKRLLDYARSCHPDETVRIEKWLASGLAENPWETRLWIVNPDEMSNGGR